MGYLIHSVENFREGAGYDLYYFDGCGSKLLKNFETDRDAWVFIRRKIKLIREEIPRKQGIT